MARRTTIRLPRGNAQETAVLSTALLTAAEAVASKQEEGKLPQEIEPARQRLVKKLAALIAVQTPKRPTAIKGAQKQAGLGLDNAWGALHDWLKGWTRLPYENQDAAIQLWTMLFKKGTAFLKATYKVKYQESDVRLLAISADDEELLDSLRGAAYLEYLREEHAAFGAALGITEPTCAVVKTSVKPQLEDLQAALRDYLNKVFAYADPELRGSRKLSTALGKPYDTWQTARKRGPAKPPKGNPPQTPNTPSKA